MKNAKWGGREMCNWAALEPYVKCLHRKRQERKIPTVALWKRQSNCFTFLPECCGLTRDTSPGLAFDKLASLFMCAVTQTIFFLPILSLSRTKKAIQTKLPESNSSKLGWTDTRLLSEWFNISESWLVLSPDMFEPLLLSDLHGFVSHMIWKVWQTNNLCIYVTWFWGCSCVWNRRKENVGSSWKYKWKIRIWKFMQCRYECL